MPIIILSVAESIPPIRIEPGIKLLLKRPQKPPFVLSRPPRPGYLGMPLAVADNLYDFSIIIFDFKSKDKTRFPGRPSPVSMPEMQGLDTDYIITGNKSMCEIKRIRFNITRITRAGSPLNSFPVYIKTITTVYINPSSCGYGPGL